ncbi:MAG: hypothetical protein FVQ77_00600 [Cytophagales bacterium]|nr:hypothetical protein [Cytophagales bacterium]
MKVKLLKIASARSGDKNDICNIGVLAKSPEHYEIIKKQLTSEKVKEHFKGLIKGKVFRYEWPVIEAINFVCHKALDGGGSRSLRMDTLGKNFASHLLRIEIDV